MKITNKHSLPQPLVNVLAKRPYSKGHARMSVTQLISAPQIVALRAKHAADMEEDVSERFWALMGTNIHHLLQDGADVEHLTEERLFAEANGWLVSGAIDVQKLTATGVKLVDWKFVSSYALKETRPEWEEQLNCYAWLVRKAKGMTVEGLEVCAIIRDWRRAIAQRDPAYPQAVIAMVSVPLWSDERQDAFVAERVHLHRDAVRSDLWGEGLPECTPEDRWLRETTYALMKKGNKRATKVFTDKAEALLALAPGFTIDIRQGEAVRCEENYCGVSAWCEQYRGNKGERADKDCIEPSGAGG